MANLTVRKGREADIARIVEIYEDFLDYEVEHGTKTNWIKGVYPTEKNARAGLEAGNLYVGEMDGEIVGSYVLNHIQPEEYAKLDWEFPGEGDEIIVIHTLCIDINQQGKGLGKEFVGFALEHGRKLGCKAMRLDTYEFNEPAAKLYTKLGFRYVGITEFFFEQAILENLICFEYKLV